MRFHMSTAVFGGKCALAPAMLTRCGSIWSNVSDAGHADAHSSTSCAARWCVSENSENPPTARSPSDASRNDHAVIEAASTNAHGKVSGRRTEGRNEPSSISRSGSGDICRSVITVTRACRKRVRADCRSTIG